MNIVILVSLSFSFEQKNTVDLQTLSSWHFSQLPRHVLTPLIDRVSIYNGSTYLLIRLTLAEEAQRQIIGH